MITDPQARFLIIDKPGFNRVKVALRTNSRQGKANALRQCNYDAIVLGASRAETAIAVNQPALRNSKAYNAALRGGTMYEMAHMAEYAVQHQDLELVLLSIDFEGFDSNVPFREDFSESPLAKTVSLAATMRHLFSIQTFRESFVTIKLNSEGDIAICADNGEHKRTYELAAARVAFDFLLRKYAQEIYSNYGSDDLHYQYLKNLLRNMAKANVRVYAFISPVHVTHLELLTEMGMHDEYESWKRRVVKVFDEANRTTPRAMQATLWDFSGYNEITTEKVPFPEDRKFMQWYTDSSHYNQYIGGLMMDRMFGLESDKSITASPFGTPLTPDNVESVLEKERVDSERYRRDNADEILRIQTMLQNLQ